MNVLTTSLSGLFIIEPKVFGDARGYFMETWNQRRFEEAGIKAQFVQDNISVSRRGILRGLHCQNPGAQAKLVSVLQGEVFDVAVDLRRSSPTFGQWHSTVLSAENKRQFFIPTGFAHGFQVLSEQAAFFYKCSDYYAPPQEMTIRWDDPRIGIPWPLSNPVLSEKDMRGVLLKDIPPDRLF